MKKVILTFLVLCTLVIPADAAEITAPAVPESGRERMPEETGSFVEGLAELLDRTLEMLQPELYGAVRTGTELIAVSLLFSLLTVVSGKNGKSVSIAAAAGISVMLFQNTGSLIRLATDTVSEICNYGKLLCPVMTAALAGQGAVTSSSALYLGTTVFTAILGSVINRFFLPLIYGLLVFSAANCAFGDACLKNFTDSIRNILSWMLKTLLTVFTTYMSITGVIAGTTDAAALKAAKLTISTVVPVVGGILSDASESVLVSMGLMKNAAGVYGILATLAIFAGPFLKVGLQYLMLKVSAGLCSIFASKNISTFLQDLSSAMGLLLAMIGAGCIMVLFSTVCFLKGVH